MTFALFSQLQNTSLSHFIAFCNPPLPFTCGQEEALEIIRFYSALVKSLLKCCVQFLVLQGHMELLEWV